ncbi:MAG: transcriptional repressor [Solirubrobacterales bacterium]|nr:transcriptional repressor [Solirubrobacterales bacterium]
MASSHVHAGPSPDWASRAGDRLAEAGYRRGGARDAVIELLAAQPCALSALEIEEALKGSARQVARASVYRVLDELEQLKLLSRIEVGQGITRYEAAHPHGEHHHHHLVCDACGEVIPFEDEELERTIVRVARRVDFDVAEHDIVLHGTCARCAAQTERTSGRTSAASP